jgi:glycosyltransferase involved in cell wall biosynthesis
MENASKKRGCVIPPPLPDPIRWESAPHPEEMIRRLGLEPDGYLLYSGNLDPYQELPLLSAASQRRPGGDRLPIVIACHDDTPQDGRISPRRESTRSSLERVFVQSAAQMHALMAAARFSVVPRRTGGGFPIKIINSLAAGTAPIVYRARVGDWGLSEDLDTLVAEDRDPVLGLTEALVQAETDPARARRLGQGARRTYLRRHRPEVVGATTLDWIEEVITAGAPPIGP